jgi:tetratricopeptide (TPR) repeat protein
MSLLLDALKKAAQEKQQASAARSEAAQAAEENKEEIEFSLDDPAPAEQQAESPAQTEPQHQTVSQPEAPAEEKLSIEPVPELEKTSATTSTVSDEALEMLVYKTNKQYRRKQKIIWGGTLASAMILLVLGGVYYYYVMVEEVEALERKHRIAMRQFESQSVTSNRKPPVVDNNTTPVQQVSVNKNTAKAVTAAPQTRETSSTRQSAGTLSIQRTNKRDPVSELLSRGWHAYGKADYAVAADAYNRVLEREPRNRDALLGIGAIAVKQGDYERARAAYKRLLQLDPRDQIAMAAMSNLDELAPDILGETRLKFMVQQQPEAAHLHFALGNYYAKQSRWPEAQGEYFSAWQGDNENADYAFNLAVSLDQLGKTDEAKRFYEKSLNLSVGQNISFSVEAVQDRLSQIAAR